MRRLRHHNSEASSAAMVAGRTVVVLAVLATLAVVGSACATSADSGPETGHSANGRELTGQITVSAAASLTEAFTRIRDDFVKANPAVKVVINFGSSGQLAAQIQAGAPVDVAAFADTDPMDAIEVAGLVSGTSKTFARNKLVIVTKPGNPQKISKLADLADVGVVSLCNDNAPCGKFADQILDDAGVSVPTTRITRAQDAKATLTAVSEGDAIAGIVYATDASTAGGKVVTVPIPDADNVMAEYTVAKIADSANTRLAAAFVDYVLGAKGQAVLKEFGFMAP